MADLIVAKIGGKVVSNLAMLDKFLRQFSDITGKKILVHGGGAKASSLAKSLGLSVQIVEGRRITDRAMLDIVTMVYGGLINKQIVATLQSCGCDALGLTGADGNIIQADKRKVDEIDFGFVGDISCINSNRIHQLLTMGITPAIAPLTHNGRGLLLNTNADTIAATIAREMSSWYKVRLYSCFEKSGVLESTDDPDSVLRSLSYNQFQEMKNSGVIADGMIPKLDTGFEALQNGVYSVSICLAEDFEEVIKGEIKANYTQLILPKSINV